MIVSSKHELFVFFGSVLGGMILGMIFDIFKATKLSDKANIVVLGIYDLLLWCIMTIAVFLIIFITNNAEVRWYEFAGMILGAVIYFMSLSGFFVAMLTTVLRMLKKVLCFLLKIVLFPIKLVFKILKPVILFVKKRLRIFKRMYINIFGKAEKFLKRIKHSVNKI